jgi:HSP20 family protein
MAQVPATMRSQGGRAAARMEHPLVQLQRDFDILLDRLWSGRLGPVAPFDQELAPLRHWDFNVTENDQEIIIRAELPGFEEDEIDVQLNDDVLTIKAEKEQNGDVQEYRTYYHSLALPPGIDADNAQATYHNGVLELHIPKTEGANARHIKVQGQQATSGEEGAQDAKSKDSGKSRK